MRVALQEVAKRSALDAVSVSFATGGAVLVEAETEQRPTVLGLIASGRMRPDAGAVLIDDRIDAAAIRRVVALVDAPEVCDPAPDVTVIGLVEEELMFAGRPSNLVSARRWLKANGFAELGRMPISAVAPRDRIALLLELTALRTRVEGMVLVSPDRHGGDPAAWWGVVRDFADRGYAMLVIAGAASAIVLGAADAASEVVETEADPAPAEGESLQGRTLDRSEPLPSPDSPSLAEEESPPEPDEPDEPDDLEEEE